MGSLCSPYIPAMTIEINSPRCSPSPRSASRRGARKRRLQLRLQLGGIADPDRFQPERLRNAGEIDRRIGEIHADIMIVAMEGEQALLDDAVAAIVDDHDRERQLVMRAVHSAWIEYIALPSPEKHTTGRSGLARLTPTEAGKPQPMPPEASA